MFNKLKQFLSPPELEDEELNLSAQMLGVILPILFLASLLALPLFIVAGAIEHVAFNVWRMLIQLAFLASSFIFFKQGKIRLACVLVIVSIWGNLMIGVFRSHNLLSAEIFGFFVLVVLTGLLLGRWYTLAVALISSVSVFSVLLINLSEFPFPMQTSMELWRIWITITIAFFITAILMQLGSNTLRAMVKRANESKAGYLLLFNESPQGIIILNQEGRIALANPYALNTLGYEEQDVAGRSPQILFDDDPQINTTAHELLPPEGTLYIEKNLRCKDGRYIPASIKVKQMPDGRFQYIFQDISERKQAGEELRQRDSILQAATYAAQQFMKATDWRTNIDAVLERLGKVLDVSHAYLFENHQDDKGIEVGSMRYEWAAPGFKNELNDPNFQNIPLLAEGFERSYQDMINGEPFVGSSDIFYPEEKEYLENMGIKAIVEMPIFVEGYWWGTIGFDDSVRERNWQPADVDALRVVANVVSAAVQRQTADAGRRESERIYRRAIESIGAVPYFQSYEPNDFLFMGEGISYLTGYTASEITPDMWNSIAEEKQVAGEASGMSEEDALILARTGKIKIWKCDYLIRTKDGRKRWISDTAVEMLNDAGVSSGSLGIFQDITDRKSIGDIIATVAFAAEQFLKAPDWRTHVTQVLEQLGKNLNASHAYIFVHHPDENGVIVASMRYEWCAPGFPNELELPDFQNAPLLEEGYERSYNTLSAGEAFIGTTATFPPNEKEYMDSIGLKAVIEIPIFVDEKWWGTLGFDDYTNEREWAYAEINALKVAANMFSAAIKRETIEAEIREMNAELEQRVLERTSQLTAANKELESFSYTVSHDLRAPLRAIRGYSQILMSESGAKLNDEERENLQRVMDASLRLNELIESLLAFARLSRREMKRSQVNLSLRAQTTLEHLREHESSRTVICHIVPGIIVNADEHLIGNVLDNLLGNAWKYTSKTDHAVIELGETRINGEKVIFVRDNGVGFDMRFIDKLFHPFQRLHSPADFEGHGIGLATVQRIIQRHGGRIWAESEPNKGATFYFTLG